MARFIVLAILLLVPSVSAAAQEPSPSEDTHRQFALFAGAGPSMGWLGAQVELYGHDQVSAFLGVGIDPAHLGSGEGSDESASPALAGGFRAYTSDTRQRAFVEVSLSQVWWQSSSTLSATSVHRSYGPGVQLGYQYGARSGFSVFASAGAGVPATNSFGAPDIVPLAGLGVGYTH